MINLLVLSVETNFAFALMCSVIGCRHFLKQIRINGDLLVRVFPRFAPVTRAFVSNSDWFIVYVLYYTSVVIGQSNYFCLVIQPSAENLSIAITYIERP